MEFAKQIHTLLELLMTVIMLTHLMIQWNGIYIRVNKD